jgi:hypothetical protein
MLIIQEHNNFVFRANHRFEINHTSNEPLISDLFSLIAQIYSGRGLLDVLLSNIL